MSMKLLSKLTISLPFCILISVMYLLDFGKVFVPVLLAVLLHESAHILVIRLMGYEIEKVDVRAFGISVKVEGIEYIPYTKEIIIAAAGPLAGIVTACVFLVAAKSFGIYSLGYFAGVNIVITAINLLPVYPLDGGRIVLCTLAKFMAHRVAYTIAYILSILSAGALFGLCAYFASVGELNPSLVIFSSYVAICGIRAPRL